MRSIFRQRSRKGMARAFKLGFLGLIMMTVGTGQALAQTTAQAKSCNSDLDFNITEPGPYFLNDEMRVSANIGARDIDGGNHMDIESFGFALNCHADEDFHSCTDAGNDVAFLNQPVTDCLNAEGEAAGLLVPQDNIKPIRVQGPPIRTLKNSQCNVQFDISVTDLDRDENGDIVNNRIVQAMGWPIEGGDPALCDNGLTSAATSTISYDVETCGIEVEKQVSIDQQNWFDADGGDDGSLTISYADRAYYRLIIKNTSSVDYIGQMHITDPELEFDEWVDGIAAGEEVTLGGDGSGFDVDTICELQGEGDFTFTNTATVEGFCRTGAHPLGEVSASASDVAVVNCRTVRTSPGVLIEKSTNGFDADTAPGPTVDWGSQVTWDYVVYNVGQEPLTLTAVYDDLEGNIECEKSQLAVSEFTNCTAKTGTAISGQYANLATVEATSATSGTQVSDTDPSHYYAEPPQPAIKVLKEVWDGQGWADANDEGTAPVKYWPSGALYRVTVENTGPVALDNVTITDAEVGIDNLTVNAGSLAVGQKVVLSEAEVGALNDVGVCTESGSYENTVIANGKGVVNGLSVQSTDNAFVVCVGRPDILVKKYIRTSDEGEWHDAGIPELQVPPLPPVDPADPVPVDSGAQYKITVKNTGQVDLVNVIINDPFISDQPFALGNGNGPEEVDLTVGQEVTILQGDWAALNQEAVCITSGIFQNVATVSGTSDEWDIDSDTDTDDAFLECIGDPRIKITKEVSVDDGGNWWDANTAPYPTALVEDSPQALYRITVENLDDEVTLYDVVLNDAELELVDYPLGTLAPLAKVVITPVGHGGDVQDDDFIEADICPNTGEKTNTVSATGTSEAGESDTSSDLATVDCIGSPEIRVVKKVSKDGVNFFDANSSAAAVVALAPAAAWYQIEVTNIGNEALENVSITDEDLGILDFVPEGLDGPGMLRKGETVIIMHAEAGLNTVEALYDELVCETGGDPFENIVVVVSDSAESGAQPTDDDNAWFDCDEPQNICVDDEGNILGSPTTLKMEYNSTPTGSNAQNAVGTFVNGYTAADWDLVTTVNISEFIGNKISDGKDIPYESGSVVVIDGSFREGGASKIPPTIRLEFRTESGEAVQWITFHGSCSAPLYIGDEYSGLTIIGHTR